MAEPERRRVTILVPVLLLAGIGLLSLLAYNLRNLDRGAEELPPLPTFEEPPETAVREGSGAPLRLLFTAIVITFFVVAIVGAILLKARGVKLFSVWELLGFVLAAVFLVCALLFWDEILAGLNNFVRWVTGPRESEPG